MRVLSALRYYWVIAAGYRLRPWQSPYVRWRLETYFGKQGHTQSGGEFFRLLWRERAHLSAFLEWVEERRAAKRETGF
ncbi:MAG: hypothetical protein HY046_09765 [Acidobacteria bacterium]|nr:hypothetical protein [Acidobacteriota bacterium]